MRRKAADSGERYSEPTKREESEKRTKRPILRFFESTLHDGASALCLLAAPVHGRLTKLFKNTTKSNQTRALLRDGEYQLRLYLHDWDLKAPRYHSSEGARTKSLKTTQVD